MKQMNKIIMFMLLVSLVFVSGCDADLEVEYNKCTAVCSSVLEEDFVTMNLCVDECREKFLGEE
jgi:uncharacterized membrane protein